MSCIHLFVSAPVAGFRVAYAREYWETYPVPPPSTVFGMLLSLVGETDRCHHAGAEVALALISEPARSTVLRSVWRIKDKKVGPGQGTNKRPEFQEILSNICLSVWVRRGSIEAAPEPLAARVAHAIESPGSVSRFGGLSLGESTHLVDEVRTWRAEDAAEGRLLVADSRGDLALHLWPDHVGSKGTCWGQYRLQTGRIDASPPAEAWSSIRPPTE